VLEHYRFAVYELTRQNLLLRRQIDAAEARIAEREAAVSALPAGAAGNLNGVAGGGAGGEGMDAKRLSMPRRLPAKGSQAR
jgi:hypothetical protein